MKYVTVLKGLIFLVLSALLAGCAAVVVAGAAGCMAVYGLAVVMTMIEHDARIFYQVHTALARDQRFRIHVF